MNERLFQSLAEFAPLILPCLSNAGASSATQIGGDHEGLTRILADQCDNLTCINSCPSRAFIEWSRVVPNVTLIVKQSLEALDQSDPADAWFIDGDHNYFSVYHELKRIHALQIESERPLLAFIHQVSWPCARRDFYSVPNRIPAGWRHPHSFDHGVTLDNARALRGQGLRAGENGAVALMEGGKQNGVLSAVEDFLCEAELADRALRYVHIPALQGLGIVFDKHAPWSDALAQFLLPYHANPLIARLEESRLRSGLEVIEWQNRAAS